MLRPAGLPERALAEGPSSDVDTNAGANVQEGLLGDAACRASIQCGGLRCCPKGAPRAWDGPERSGVLARFAKERDNVDHSRPRQDVQSLFK